MFFVYARAARPDPFLLMAGVLCFASGTNDTTTRFGKEKTRDRDGIFYLI